jgi:hypothetical protein
LIAFRKSTLDGKSSFPRPGNGRHTSRIWLHEGRLAEHSDALVGAQRFLLAPQRFANAPMEQELRRVHALDDRSAAPRASPAFPRAPNQAISRRSFSA